MNELYNILSVFVTSSLFLICALMFLFMRIPDTPRLASYRKARWMMCGAYIFFVIVEIAKFLFGDTAAYSVPLLRTVVLVIASSQAFLFTFSILALLDVRFSGWFPVFREAAPALGLMVAIPATYAFCTEACFNTFFYGFAGIYVLLMARYTFLFIKNYRIFRRRMDNYFSSNEADRMRWIMFSFYVILTIGVMALLISIFMSIYVVLVFTVVFDIFYIYFAIRFINYAHCFHVIETATDNDFMDTDTAMNGNIPYSDSKNFNALEKRIEEWVAAKGFTEKYMTINALVPKLYTNRHYLSTYINTCKRKSFREWINELRIEEAKRLLLEYPDMSVSEIASRIGFATQSHFGQQFRASTGLSPKSYREQTDGSVDRAKIKQ